MANLLVVDDDPDLAESLGLLLEAGGHEVRVARNGNEGLQRVGEQPPDLIVVDVEMPVLSGPEMSYRMLVHNAGQERIPIVLLSGITSLRKVAELVGTPYFLPKPSSFDAINGMVVRALVERRPPVPSRLRAEPPP